MKSQNFRAQGDFRLPLIRKVKPVFLEQMFFSPLNTYFYFFCLKEIMKFEYHFRTLEETFCENLLIDYEGVRLRHAQSSDKHQDYHVEWSPKRWLHIQTRYNILST